LSDGRQGLECVGCSCAVGTAWSDGGVGGNSTRWSRTCEVPGAASESDTHVRDALVAQWRADALAQEGV